MRTTKDLFNDFPPITRAQWLEKIKKDLKGKAIEELYWKATEDIIIDPFFLTPNSGDHTSTLANKNNWQICQEIVVTDSKSANAQALEALTGGAEAIQFRLSSNIITAQLSLLLKGIHLNYISIHFTGSGIDEEWIDAFINYARQQKINLEQLNGSFELSGVEASGSYFTEPVLSFVEGVEKILSSLPQFKINVFSNGEIPNSVAQVINSLVEQTVNGIKFLSTLKDQTAVDHIEKSLRFTFSVGENFFLNIAMLRAFRLVWANALSAMGLPIDQMPTIASQVNLNQTDKDFNTQLIYATTQATAAVFGGAQLLTIIPPQGDSFQNRMTRNIQHLMKMESYLDQVVDPAAGSHFIEQLTFKIAERTWKGFQQTMK